MRHPLRFPRLSRLLCVLACLHVLAPALAAAADGWRLDGRVAYSHIESEGNDGCIPVHAHNCLLCEVATHSSGDTVRATTCRSARSLSAPGNSSQRAQPRSSWYATRSARAPPELG